MTWTFKASTRKHPKGYVAAVVRITGRKFDSLMYYKIFSTRHQAYRNSREICSTLTDMEERMNNPRKKKKVKESV